MKSTDKGIIDKNVRIRWVITILLLITIGKGIGAAIGAFLDISNQIVLFFLEIFCTVIILAFICFRYSVYDIENVTNIKALLIKNSLKKALEREEFIIYYQPQVDIETKQIIKCEALLRWNHPKMGIVPPKDFIPIAEKTGLIVSIGEWVLREASKQLKIWHSMGFKDLRLSVNISARQFQEPNLVDTISDILDSTGLEHNFLELEITENSAMQDIKLAMKTVKQLKTMGIKIAIDDFGTGFSSLNYIREFLADILKIDKSFVWNVTRDINDAALTAAIIQMAKTLNMGVVAEGVETKEQLDFLYSKGCKQIQGYLISPPVEPQAFVQLLSQGIPKE
jgi:EAL domain-containing protein (putative c-di-GMP-specific phosphodiesterase class I)